ncbi:hypothetical protein AT251_06935 [Enterovibrio nigricans]|nr:hypothetical protein AT251_06935 [Enterovibrio nigricans]
MRILRLRTWKTLPFIVLMFLLSACTNQLAYNTLPFWVDYYLSDYVDLTSAQQKQWDSDLEAFHAWHRQHELPKIHALITQLERDMAQPLSYSKVGAYHSDVNTRILASLEGLTPALTNLVRSLDNDQADQWLAVLSQNIDKAIKKANEGNLQLQQKKRQEKLIKHAMFWVESVNTAQSRQFLEMASYQIEMRPVFYAIRDELMADLTKILTERDAPDLHNRINAYFAKIVSFQSEAYEKEIALHQARRYELLQRIDKHLSEKQRNAMREKLTSISRDINALLD